MASKKPSITTQLKAAKAEAAEQKAHAEKLQKDLASANQTLDMYRNRNTNAEGELDQIHAFLNAVPNPPAEKLEGSYNKLGAMTRLSVFLATRAGVSNVN